MHTTEPIPVAAERLLARRRALVAAPLSLLVPGLGQLYNGNLRRAALFASISVALQAAATLAPSIPPTSWLVFLGAFVLALSSPVFRIVAMVDAAWKARRVRAIVPAPWNRPSVYFIGIVAGVSTGILLEGLGGTPTFRSYNSPAGSMLPTILQGEHFLTWRGYYEEHAAERGDLVVFKLPTKPSIDYIKRIVGMPGDRIQMVRGILHINGEAVKLQRLPDWRPPGDGKGIAQFSETLPGGRAYRIIDFADRGEFDDTPVFVVPPDHYFVLGDNRDNSLDSRVPRERQGVGFVPRENLRDRPVFIYWSPDWGRIGTALD